MSVNYNYKIKHKFIKRKKDGSVDIEKMGFVRFVNDEQDEEIIYALPVKVNPESVIVRGLIADLNNPDWQRAANITNVKRKESLAKKGLTWTKQDDGTYKVDETKELIDEFSQAHLCVAVESVGDIPVGMLLLKGGDGILRGSTKTIDIACKEVIDKMISDGIIYKKKVSKK